MSAELQRRLVFLISAPRSGSTLLTRILNATPDVHSRPEPHLITPLAHLGFWERVREAPYDPIISQQAIRQLVGVLPGGEDAYLGACRAYADAIYGPLLRQGGKRYFLDKTPAYALVLPFLIRLYPDARYIVLTRHPAAIACSHARSFFDGDLVEAARINPVLARYVPPIAAMLRDPPQHMCHLRYESLVTEPEAALAALSELLEVSLPARALDYQSAPLQGRGPGDPIGVHRHQRPVTGPVSAWAASITDAERALVAHQLAAVTDEELALWGYPRETLWAPVEGRGARRTPGRRWDRLAVERRVLRWARLLSRRAPARRAVIALRDACDVLLRG